MQITGPLKIGVIDTDIGAHELHFDFTEEFIVMRKMPTVRTCCLQINVFYPRKTQKTQKKTFI